MPKCPPLDNSADEPKKPRSLFIIREQLVKKYRCEECNALHHFLPRNRQCRGCEQIVDFRRVR